MVCRLHREAREGWCHDSTAQGSNTRGKGGMSSFKPSGKEGKSSFPSIFVLPRPLTDWIRHVHSGEGRRICSAPNSHADLFRKHADTFRRNP